MAAPKENLLSLGHLTGTEKNTFTQQRDYGIKKRINRPALLQDFSTIQSQKHLRVMHLQQRWQELEERERMAQQHNRQLLQQFEKAQETLKDMLARNAAMKTIRMEYERYLEESYPRWQQQFMEKTQTAQKKRTEDCLRTCVNDTEEQRVKKSSVDQPLLSQGPATRPKKPAASEMYSSHEASNYKQDSSSHLPFPHSCWLTHTQSQTGRFPIRVPYQPPTSSQVPPSFFPTPTFQHPHPYPLHHFVSTTGYPHHGPRQDPPDSASPHYDDNPWSWAAGAAAILSGFEALWGQLSVEEPPSEARVSQTEREEDEKSSSPSSKRERGRGSRSSHVSQELDVKPVRLSSSLAESTESSRDSSLASREKRKKREKRGRTQRTSSDRERGSSQESSRASSAIVLASVAVAQNSERDASSEKGHSSSSTRRMRRSGGLAAVSPRSEKMAKEKTRSDEHSSESHNEESHNTGEELRTSSEESTSSKVGNQSHDNKPESCREESGSQRTEESGSDSIQIENGVTGEKEKQESSSSAQSSTDEKDEGERKKNLGAGEEDEEEDNSQEDEEEEHKDVEKDDDHEDEVSEEEVELAAEDELEDQGDDEEQSNRSKNEDTENRKQDSASSQDEEVDEDGSEGIEDKKEEGEGSNEEDGESEEEEEDRGDEAEPEDRDSDDSIISPQEKRPKQMQIIPEEAAVDNEGDEDEEQSEAGSSNDNSNENSDEDIESLLAPQEQTKQKEENDLKIEEKPKAVCDNVEIFQAEQDRSNTDQPGESDEFDHFYD